MTFNPYVTARDIKRHYLDYVAATFTPRRQGFADAYRDSLDNTDAVGADLLLQPVHKFKQGADVEGLVGSGTLHHNFLAAIQSDTREGALPQKLYEHQSTAIHRAVNERRNLVIATGTGSGKTEALLIPILNELLREHDEGTISQPGTRALLLYPMNALAADQLKRLRALFATLPETIKFGRYVGSTEHSNDKALTDFQTRNGPDPTPHELLSRDAIHATPPHILITNYAMLERLLLLPGVDTNRLFSKRLRFIALDEAHVYDGAKGTEIAYLLRRVRQRTVGSKGQLQCFAASATIGDGSDTSREAVAAFAAGLFDEPFTPNDVITATYDNHQVPHDDPVRAAAINTLNRRNLINLGNPEWELLRQTLEEGTTQLPVRCHQIIRAPFGAFVCLHPGHPDGNPRMRLTHSRSCAACAEQGLESRLVELATCRNCGAEHLTGHFNGNVWRVGGGGEGGTDILLLGDTGIHQLDSQPVEPGAAGVNVPAPLAEGDRLCIECLQLNTADSSCGHRTTVIVWRQPSPKKNDQGEPDPRPCLHCGYKSGGLRTTIRPAAGADRLASVLGSTLYRRLPDNHKLLIFSDSRQDAAKFAPLFQRDHDLRLRRRLIFDAAGSIKGQPTWNRVANELTDLIKKRRHS